jgi:chromosome segregation ATPase
METDVKVEQQAQAQEQANVQESTNSSAEVGQLIADAKKYRHQRQEAEAKVTALQDQLNLNQEAEMQKNNEWKDLATKYKSERDEYKSQAKEGLKIKESVRKDLLNQLSDEDREFAIELSTEKLQKFVSRSSNQTVKTNESYSTPMPDNSVNPFVDMTKEQRQRNWGKVIQNYAKK